MKLVTESLYEFKREGSTLSNLGIGKEVIIKQWLEKHNAAKPIYKINADFTIDVEGEFGDVELAYGALGNMTELPEFINFNKVKGDFNIAYNKLTSLRGCPKKCRSFYCEGNRLSSLDHCPKYVKKTFSCFGNLNSFSSDAIRALCKGHYKISNDAPTGFYCPR